MSATFCRGLSLCAPGCGDVSAQGRLGRGRGLSPVLDPLYLQPIYFTFEPLKYFNCLLYQGLHPVGEKIEGICVAEEMAKRKKAAELTSETG